jgi:hypothetical protein
MSQIIINIGDSPDDGEGTQLRQAFSDINIMMSEIYAAGPVDSQVVITNNSITTNVTNANLILAPSGIGVVRVTNHLVPNVDDVYDLGTYYPELLRWNSIWVGTGGINSSGSMTVDGNLTVGGIISGDGGGLTNVTANVGAAVRIQNGTTDFNIPVANGNIIANVAGTTDVLTISQDGLNVTANVSAGNVISNNYLFANGQSIFDSIVTDITVGANTGLEYTSNTLFTIYNTTVGANVLSVPVGGAVAQPASFWNTLNLVEVLDEILFPDLNPDYVVPTLTLSANISGVHEIGNSISQDLTTIGTENDAGVYTLLEILRGANVIASVSNPTGTLTANIAPQYGYDDPNNPNYQYTLNHTDNYTVEPGITEWTAQGSYDSGLAKVNNKGATDTRSPAVRSTSAPQAAANITSSISTVTGLYPYFWGKTASLPTATDIANAIAAGTENKVLADSNGTISVIYNAFDEYIWMAHEAGYTEKTAWYFNDYNQGLIGSGNFILSPSTENVNSPDGYWSGVSYKIYISDSPTITYDTLEYRNT